MNSDFLSLLLTIITSGAVSSLIIYLAKSWIAERLKQAIAHAYTQKLEAYRAALKSDYDVQLERLRDEVSGLSARLDLAALRDYYTAVGRRTVEVVRSLRPGALDEVPDLHRLRAEGIVRENALWVIEQREGQSKGQWLGQLGMSHSQPLWEGTCDTVSCTP